MVDLLSQDQVVIFINNYGRGFEGNDAIGNFVSMLEDSCKTGSRVVSLEKLNLGIKWRYHTAEFRCRPGDLSFSSKTTIEVHVYNREKF